jgi:DNA-binding CsgD family transcriptional regulator
VSFLSVPTALVGRVSELNTLTTSLDEARAGRGRIMLIGGVPGIGKSRLALEVSRLATPLGAIVLWGRCFEGEGARGFAPWVEALGGYVQELERNQLQQQLGQHAANMAQIFPNVRDALPDLPPATSTTPGEDRMRLFDGVVHVVLAAAQEHLVLLVLDDLHWADRASLALLRHLARHTADAAILVLGTLREEELAANHPLDELMAMLRREAPCQHITLPDLSLAESSAMAALVLEQRSQDQTPARLDDVLAETLLTQTSGNPFFIQEMVRDLIETGRVVRRQDHWVAVSPTVAWEVPREVRDVIDRRLRRLPAPAQRLLHAACACTAAFTFADAQALTGAEDEPLLDSIDAALNGQLLRIADPAVMPARYEFGHALIRHALYARLNPDRRARLHLRTAQALERVSVTDEQVGALATHYRLAGRFAAPERSIDYAVRAGDVAQAGFAYEDAVTHWQSALGLMAEHGVDAERRAALLEKLGDQLFMSNPAGDLALAYHEQALALYEQIGQRDAVARIHLRLGLLFGNAGIERQDIPRALRHARAAAMSVPPNELSMRHAQIESLFALACFYSLQLEEALAASQRAMSTVAGLDNDVARVIVYVHRGFCLAAAGELSASQALMAEGYEIANRLNQPFFGAMASGWAGRTRCDVLDPADACRWSATELAQPRTANSPRQRQMLAFDVARARLMMGAVAEPTRDLPTAGLFHVMLEAASAYVSGDWSACRAAATAALDLTRRRGYRLAEFSAAHQLARLALAEDDLSGAEDLLGRSLELAAGQHRPYEALVLTDLAVLYAIQGRIPEARSAVERSRASMLAGEDWRGLVGRLALAEAMLEAAPGRSAAAQGTFKQAIAVLRHYQLPWDEAQALECWGAVLIKEGEPKLGDRRFDAAAALYRRHGAGRQWLQRLARLRAGAHHGYAPDALAAQPERLSHREVQVLGLVAAGYSNQEIADTLVLSVRTVERHLGHVYDKLGVGGKSARAVATAYGIGHGLVPAPAA